MRTRLVFPIALLCLVLMSAIVEARPRHGSRITCPPRNEGVLERDSQAVVYWAETIVYEGHHRVEGRRGVFGCAHRGSRAYYLGPPTSGGSSGSESTAPIALAGPTVAFGKAMSLIFGNSFREIWVRNLRTGKLIHRSPNGSPPAPGSVGLGETTAIVVKRNGSVAWIVRTRDGLQVRSIDGAGSHLLAASPEIAPSSLALADSMLRWTQSGKRMSAVLN